MELKIRPRLLRAKRIISDDRDNHYSVDYAFRLDEIRSIAMDYRYLPEFPGDKCVVVTNKEIVVLLVDFESLYKLWSSSMKDYNILMFNNKN